MQLTLKIFCETKSQKHFSDIDTFKVMFKKYNSWYYITNHVPEFEI